VKQQLFFVLQRRQCLPIPAFSVALYKSGGQTFLYFGIFREEPVFFT